MICPRCKTEVTTRKYERFFCPCGRILMVIKINKKEEVVDVTPDKEDK